jgi:hypothetical protein
MKITRTWIILRIQETRWPRGTKAPVQPAANPLSPVVAVVGIKGDPGNTTASSWITADW